MPKRKPTQQPTALPSNVIPFPLERSKARPVVMKGRTEPLAELVAALRRAQFATDVHFEGLIVEARERLGGRHV